VLESRTPGDAAALVRQLGADPVVITEASPLAHDLLTAGFIQIDRLEGLLFLSPPAPPLPRVALVPRAVAVDAETAIAAARLGRALDEQHVLVEADVLPGGAEGDRAGRLEVLEYEPGALHARVTVDRPTWLVVREPYYRNWRALVDGQRAGLYPAAGFVLGILVDVGTHDVHLAYREPKLAVGVVLAVLAAVFLPAALRGAVSWAGRPA
jgi:hypothetical protein